MTTTIQTIKEAEERIKSNFKRDNTGEKVEGYLLYPSVTYNTEQYVKIATQNDVMQEVRQTLLAVFESELERKKAKKIYFKPQISNIMWEQGYNQSIDEDIFHLIEVINYLKQK